MRRQHLIAGAVTAAALAGGAAGAVAATDDHKAAEQSILSDAAKRLGVSGPGQFGPGGHGHGGPGGPFMLGDAAKAIGIGADALVTQLRDGKSLAAIAKAHGKTLSDVKAAVEAAATKRLDADLKAGRITQAQRDELAGHLDEAIDHLGDARDRGPHGPGPWGHDDDRP